MKHRTLAVLAALPLALAASEWPVVRSFDSDHLARIALPLGGIGTGTISLGGRGELRDFEMMNRPAKGLFGVDDYFAISVKGANTPRRTKMLAGPLCDFEYLDANGKSAFNHGLPRFTAASFKAAYPFGQVFLTDRSIPVEVRIKGFNPLVPGDVEASSLPIASLRYEVTNVSGETLEVSVCGSLRNIIGCDGTKTMPDWNGNPIFCGMKNNVNEFREGEVVRGIAFLPGDVDPKDAAWGTMALVTAEKDGVSWRVDGPPNDWSKKSQDFWDDFSADGEVTQREKSADSDPMGSLCVKKSIQPGETKAFQFWITWSFPNRKTWFGKGTEGETVGNWYTRRFPDAWKAACDIVPEMESLERRTLDFVRGVLALDAPAELKDAALSNLSVLRSQTTFRTADGRFFGWEGTFDNVGSCHGSCTHVWNYDEALPFLFPELARTMRDVEFNFSLHDDGLMSFRAEMPIETNAKNWNLAAADGQMGCVMKVYREWRVCGDDAWMKSLWPKVRKALEYAWREGSWDADRDGVMEGVQHNTMDVNYHGPNAQMQFWYFGALKAAAAMASAVGEPDFAAECESILAKGVAWTDENLFNGEYYEHRVTPGCQAEYQVGKGCLIDQFAGATTAEICGLGRIGDEEKRRTALKSVLKYNRRDDMSGEYRHQRSYVMGDEAGILMATWPRGERERFPFPYFDEVWTGMEYVFASELIFSGMRDEALRVVRDVRARYDGSKRNPFSEPECGHHYARALASWGTLRAWTGEKLP